MIAWRHDMPLNCGVPWVPLIAEVIAKVEDCFVDRIRKEVFPLNYMQVFMVGAHVPNLLGSGCELLTELPKGCQQRIPLSKFTVHHRAPEPCCHLVARPAGTSPVARPAIPASCPRRRP